MPFAQLGLYRNCATVVDTNLDREAGDDPAMVIVNVLSQSVDVDPNELPRLYEAIDPDIINKLVDGNSNTGGRPSILGFEYDRWNVFVNSNGRIRICDTTETVDPLPIFETIES